MQPIYETTPLPAIMLRMAPGWPNSPATACRSNSPESTTNSGRPRAAEFLQYVTTNDIRALRDGKGTVFLSAYGRGGIVDDILIYRIDAGTFLNIGLGAAIPCAWRWVSAFTGTTSTILLRRSRPVSAGLRSVDGNDFIDRPLFEVQKKRGRTASGRFRTDRTGNSPARLRACGSGRADDRGGDFRNDVADAEKGIGMGYVQSAFAAPGTDIDVVIRNKPVRARVVKMPFLKRRERSSADIKTKGG
ncbi:unnamed protein product, partial [Mycena citricolor]